MKAPMPQPYLMACRALLSSPPNIATSSCCCCLSSLNCRSSSPAVSSDCLAAARAAAAARSRSRMYGFWRDSSDDSRSHSMLDLHTQPVCLVSDYCMIGDFSVCLVFSCGVIHCKGWTTCVRVTATSTKYRSPTVVHWQPNTHQHLQQQRCSLGQKTPGLPYPPLFLLDSVLQLLLQCCQLPSRCCCLCCCCCLLSFLQCMFELCCFTVDFAEGVFVLCL